MQTTNVAGHIRWMIRRDMVEVLQIEKENFGEWAWNEEDFISCLKQRNCIGMIIERGEKVLGFMIYELHPGKIRLLNMAVDPKYTKQGLGSLMAEKLISKLTHDKYKKIVFELRESNLQSQLFFRSKGFKAVKILDDFYNNGETAYRFRYKL